MTKEQAIKKIKWSIHISELTKNINGSNASINVEVLKTVLSMLEEKDELIQFKEDINHTELDRHNKTEKNLKGIINKQNKIIDLMAEQLAGLTIFDIDKDEPLILGDKEDVEIYFKEKVKEII